MAEKTETLLRRTSESEVTGFSQRQDLPHNLWNSESHVKLPRAWEEELKEWCTHKRKKELLVNTGTAKSHGITALYQQVAQPHESNSLVIIGGNGDVRGCRWLRYVSG